MPGGRTRKRPASPGPESEKKSARNKKKAKLSAAAFFVAAAETGEKAMNAGTKKVLDNEWKKFRSWLDEMFETAPDELKKNVPKLKRDDETTWILPHAAQRGYYHWLASHGYSAGYLEQLVGSHQQNTIARCLVPGYNWLYEKPAALVPKLNAFLADKSEGTAPLFPYDLICLRRWLKGANVFGEDHPNRRMYTLLVFLFGTCSRISTAVCRMFGVISVAVRIARRPLRLLFPRPTCEFLFHAAAGDARPGANLNRSSRRQQHETAAGRNYTRVTLASGTLPLVPRLTPTFLRHPTLVHWR